MLLRLVPTPKLPGSPPEGGSRGPSAPRPCGRARSGAGSGRLEIDRAGLAAAVRLELVGDALVAIEGAHSGALDGADVHERVGPAALGRDEAVALVGVEEFHGAGNHGL